MKKRRECERSGAPRDGSREAADTAGRRGKYLAIVFLVALVLISYGQVIGFDFVSYDDDLYVTDNPRLEAGLTPDNVIWAFTTEKGGNWHPLTWLSYMLDADLFGVHDPGAFHAVNVLFHLVNSILLFLLLLRMTRQLWPSFLVAALFAVHPLHVESVAWIAERKDVLSTFFWLLTMLAYAHYAASPGCRGPGNPSRLPVGGTMLVVVLFVLGLMAKPMLVTLPAVLLLMDYWPLRRALGKGLVIEKLPLFAVVLVFSALTIFTQRGGQNVISLSELPLWLRAANAVVAYGKYSVMTAAPVSLTMFYPHPGFHLQIGQVIVSGGFLVAVSVAVVRWRGNYPYLLVGWLWYLGTLVPVIGFIQIGAQALADRYAYVPLIGLFIMVAWGIQDLKWAGFSKTVPHPSPSREASSGRFAGCPNRLKTRPTLLAVGVCAVLAALTAASGIQVSYWRDSTTLYEHALRADPSNYLAHNNLGVLLVREKRLDEARVHFAKAVEAKSDYIEAINNLCAVLKDQEKYDEAIAEYQKALTQNIPDSGAYKHLATLLVHQGRAAEAIPNYVTAMRIKPTDPVIPDKLGSALASLGRFDEAARAFETALAIKPEYVDARLHLAEALAQAGKHEEAIRQYREAIKTDPGNVQARLDLAQLLVLDRQFEEVKRLYLEVTEINPAQRDAYFNLGVLSAVLGETDAAVGYYRKVLELDPNDAATRDLLNHTQTKEPK